MAARNVLVASAHELDLLVAPIALAFAGDPFVRWYLPRPSQFLDVFPRVVRLHAEAVAPHGGAYRTEDFRGAALWYPPGAEPNTSADSRALYERQGFSVIGEVRVGEAPPVWPMLRPARPRGARAA